MENRTTDNHARTTIALGLAAAVCEGIDLQAPGLAAAGIRAEFSPTPGQLGDFLAAGTLGLFIGAIIGGWLADRFGRRRVLIGSIALFGLFSLANAWAPTYLLLYWTRFVTGLGLGGAFPMLVTMVAEASRPERRLANVAMAFAGAPAGGILASLLGAFLQPAQWRAIFVFGGVVPLLLAGLMLLKLRESSEFATRVAGDAGTRARAGDFRSILAEGRAVPTLLLWASFFLGLLILYLCLTWLPLLLTDTGFSSRQASIAQLGFNLGGGVAAVFVGRLLTSRWRLPGLLLAITGVPLFLYLLAVTGGSFASVAAKVLLLGSSVMGLQAFFYATGPQIYPAWIRGVGMGMVVAVGRVGSYVGPKAGGYFRGLGHSPSQLLLDLLPIALLGSVCALLLALRPPRQPGP